jgi:hypothetical protein
MASNETMTKGKGVKLLPAIACECGVKQRFTLSGYNHEDHGSGGIA